MTPKIIQKSASEPRARPGPAQGPPRGLQRPFWEAFGLILASIRSLRELMSELFRGARLGSVAGLGAQPHWIRPLSLFKAQEGAVERSELKV